MREECEMKVGIMRIRLYAPWVRSLKEKRMIIQSLIARLKRKFNVSIAEVGEQDTHQSIVLGIACVAGNSAHGDSILEHVTSFVENSTEAEITGIERESITY
jgi:uncharacterized protein YlxP (DUF503 family)